MPSPRIKLVATGTQAQLNSAKSAAPNIPQNRIQRTTYNWTITNNDDGTLTNVLDFELKTRAWGDAAWADFLAALPAIKATGVTGVVHYHQCSHLDPVVVDCRTHPSSQFMEEVV